MQKFIDEYYTEGGKLYRRNPFQEVGWLCSNGYLMFDHEGKKYLVHRMIFLLSYGYLPPLVDHKDRDKLNNHPSNLREFSKSENAINSGPRKDSASGYKGISFNQNGRWHVYLNVNGVRHQGGYYLKLKDAVNARIELEKKYYGKQITDTYAEIH